MLVHPVSASFDVTVVPNGSFICLTSSSTSYDYLLTSRTIRPGSQNSATKIAKHCDRVIQPS